MASPVQFSIRQLLIAVAFVGLGMAALLNANPWWQSAAWTVTILLLSAAILLAVYRVEQARAFWIGFLVFGWVQLAALVYPFGAGSGYHPWALQSHAVLAIGDWAYRTIIPDSRRESMIPDPSFQGGSGFSGGMLGGPGGMPMAGGSGSMQPMSGMPMGPGGAAMMPGGGMPGMGMGMGGPIMIANPNYVDPTTFLNIVHALWLVLIATFGGKLAQWIYRTRPAVQPATS